MDDQTFKRALVNGVPLLYGAWDWQPNLTVLMQACYMMVVHVLLPRLSYGMVAKLKNSRELFRSLTKADREGAVGDF